MNYIKVKDLLKIIKPLPRDYKFKWSGYAIDYTRKHPELADGSILSYCHSDGFDFGYVGKSKNMSDTIEDFLNILEENKNDILDEDYINTWDDDGSIIYFKDVIITNDSIILV